MVHKIGRSGNWHWRQNLVVFASKVPPTPTCWQRRSLSCGGLFSTKPYWFSSPNYDHAEQHVFGNTKLKERDFANQTCPKYILHMHHKMLYYGIILYQTKMYVRICWFMLVVPMKFNLIGWKTLIHPRIIIWVASFPPPSFLQNKHLKPNEYSMQ